MDDVCRTGRALAIAAAALAVTGVGAQTTATASAGDCPAHGVLLDAAALCGAAAAAAPAAAGARRTFVSRARETSPHPALAMPLLAMPEAAPPLAMLAGSDAFAARPAIRQPAAYDTIEP